MEVRRYLQLLLLLPQAGVSAFSDGPISIRTSIKHRVNERLAHSAKRQANMRNSRNTNKPRVCHTRQKSETTNNLLALISPPKTVIYYNASMIKLSKYTNT